VQRGLGSELLPERPDTTAGNLDLHRLTGVPLDVPTTERLVFDTYRYGDLARYGAEGLETTSASVAATLGLPPALLVYAYAETRDLPRMRRAANLSARSPAAGSSAPPSRRWWTRSRWRPTPPSKSPAAPLQ
jgi:hypothetical protein